MFILFLGFNTASGKYYCNCIMIFNDMSLGNEVSTPQAVGTIAISDWDDLENDF